MRNTMGRHPAVCTPPVGRVGQEYPHSLQTAAPNHAAAVGVTQSVFPGVAGTQPQSRTVYPGAGSALPVSTQFDGVQGGPQNTLVPYLPNPVVTPPQRGHLVEVPATEIGVVGSGLLTSSTGVGRGIAGSAGIAVGVAGLPIVDQPRVPSQVGADVSQRQPVTVETEREHISMQPNDSRLAASGTLGVRPSGGGNGDAAAAQGTTTSRESDRPSRSTVQSPIAPWMQLPLMGQIPQIPPFTGEGRATGESFNEWHEHFENVAKLAGWDDHWKLVHLTSNLRDTAMAFYRSCSTEVRGQYLLLVAAMQRRFTPIRLTAVQAQLFHNRQQQDKETVDEFAQELQKLYNLAYAGATSEGPQAERMGQTLLANQFVTGLRPDLKRKLIGVEGSLEELVLKARFEEAKGRELALANSPNSRSSVVPRQAEVGSVSDHRDSDIPNLNNQDSHYEE